MKSFSCRFPVDLGECYFFGINIWQFSWSIASKSSPKLLEILLGLHHCRMTDLSLQSPQDVGWCRATQSPTLNHIIGVTQNPTLNHTVRLSGDPRLPVKQRHPYQTQYSKGLEITFQKLRVKVRPLFRQGQSFYLHTCGKFIGQRVEKGMKLFQVKGMTWLKSWQIKSPWVKGSIFIC